jgi:hypothetical protein
VDYDESEGFSPILLLERTNEGIATIQAYPNPAGDRLDVLLSSPAAGTAALSLFAADGREVLTDNRRLDAGTNSLSLDLGAVPPEVYFLRIGEEVVRVVRN